MTLSRWIKPRRSLESKDDVPVSRYVIYVTYPEGGVFNIALYGSCASDPPSYDPARLVAGMMDGLHRAGFDVKVAAERTETEWT